MKGKNNIKRLLILFFHMYEEMNLIYGRKEKKGKKKNKMTNNYIGIYVKCS